MQILVYLAILVLSGGTFFLSWKTDSERLGKVRYILLCVFLVSTGLALYGSYTQDSESQAAKAQNKTLLGSVEYLKGQQSVLLDDNKSFLTRLSDISTCYDTILSIVRTQNTIDTSNVVQLATESKLMEIKDRRKTIKDPTDGLFHSIFVFRSRNVIPLRDIRIVMNFDQPVIDCKANIRGAFVVEQGTRSSLKNPTEYHYSTDYLSQSNDIIITAVSKVPTVLSILNISP